MSLPSFRYSRVSLFALVVCGGALLSSVAAAAPPSDLDPNVQACSGLNAGDPCMTFGSFASDGTCKPTICTSILTADGGTPCNVCTPTTDGGVKSDGGVKADSGTASFDSGAGGAGGGTGGAAGAAGAGGGAGAGGAGGAGGTGVVVTPVPDAGTDAGNAAASSDSGCSVTTPGMSDFGFGAAPLGLALLPLFVRRRRAKKG